ncbi:hypothetical protein C5708_08030 [Caulobacter sp. CCUG 60055]|nr:hypothetical protein [Caulobacter sp. CCUG 60055]
MRKSYNLFAGGSLERIAALSDGLFAIAMTLIVLEIRVPAHTPIHGEAQLWGALVGLAPRFVTYLLSFLTLGIFWVGQGLHALADGSLRQALGLEQRVHPRLDGPVLLQAHLVDVVGVQRGGGADLEQPGVIGLAVRQLPDAGVVPGLGLGGLDLGDLPVEGREDLVGNQRRRLARPVAGDPLGLGALGQGLDQAGLGGLLAAILRHLIKRRLQDEVRGHDPRAGVAPDPVRLLVQRLGEGLDPRQIGVAVGAGRDLVLRVQELGQAGEHAGLLADHVGGRPLRHHRVEGVVAEGEARALEAHLQGVEHGVVIDEILAAEPRPFQRLEPAQAVGAGLGALLDRRPGPVAQPALQRRAAAIVEAEAGGRFGGFVEDFVGEGVQQAMQRRIALGAGLGTSLRPGGESRTGGQGRARGGGAHEEMSTVGAHLPFAPFIVSPGTKG